MDQLKHKTRIKKEGDISNSTFVPREFEDRLDLTSLRPDFYRHNPVGSDIFIMNIIFIILILIVIVIIILNKFDMFICLYVY